MIREITKADAIAHFKYGITHDIFSEPVISYAKLAIEALSQPPSKNHDEVIAQLEAEIDSSDKYIREYDGSKEQIAYNEGMRNALKIVKLCATEQPPRPKGRWIELPCEIGDKLYDISGKIATVNEILIDAYRTSIHVNFECDHNCKLCAFNSWHQDYSGEYECSGEWGHGYIEGIGEIGKTLFFTKEEAEKALADMRESE